MWPDRALPAQGEIEVPGPGSIHLWYVELSEHLQDATDGLHILSAEEIARAERFRDPASRERFVVARCSLRRLLGAYLDRSPQAVHLVTGPEGKPGLADKDLKNLSFNLSHSGSWILIGFAGGMPIGVDIEIVESFRDFLAVASRVFHPREVADLRRLPDGDKAEAFYRGWVRKEALQKARGIGLWDGSVEIATGLGHPSDRASTASVQDSNSLAIWTVMGVPAPSGYLAAAAMEGREFQIALSARLCIP